MNLGPDPKEPDELPGEDAPARPKWLGMRFSLYRRWEDGNEGLVEMCDYGAGRIEAGEFEHVEFRVFGTAEQTFVRNYMADKHPKVPFSLAGA